MSAQTQIVDGMIECPMCHKKNVLGSDNCVSCGHDLEDVPARQKDQLSKSLLADAVSNLDYHEPIYIDIGATVADAIRDMFAGKHGSIVIRDGSDIAGIFTERDIIYKVLGQGKDPANTPIRDVMTKNIESLVPEDPVAGALHKMAFIGCRHLPVMEGARCVGIVSVRSLVRYFAEKIL